MTTLYNGQTGTLTADFFQYSGGPASDVTNLTITVKTGDGLTTVLGPTSSGVNHVATGVYTYNWSVSANQAGGTYLAIWTSTETQATETFQIQSNPSFTGTVQVQPWYCTREDVKDALDIKQTARNDNQVDRAVEAASRSIEGLMHRVFYPVATTRYFDWPNYQLAFPWRIWFDASELADVTSTVPVVTSGGNLIPNADIFWGHPNYSPPYTYLELNRSSSSSFGQGSTPQRDVAITGVFGYDLRTAPAGLLAVALADTTGTLLQVTNGAVVGVGDNILVDSERMVVTDKVMVTSGQTQQSGLTTALNSDVSLGVTDGTKYAVGEVLLLDSERLMVVDIAGNTLTVKRAWDGSVLAAHTGATIYAARLLTVTRGDLGTTAATHLVNTAINRSAVPSLIRTLAVAEALVEVTQNAGGYAKVQGSGSGAQGGIGDGLTDLRMRAFTAYGRKARRRVI